MIKIDEEALANLDFNLGEGDEQSSLANNEITDVLQKYNLDYNETNLFASFENNCIALITYILSLYDSGTPLPLDIKQIIRYNKVFKNYLYTDITKRSKNIVEDKSIIFFREIENIFHLLSLGDKYEVFSDYDHYDFGSISSLFREYESFLKELHNNDIEGFELTFRLYLELINVFHTVCGVTSTDIQRKKNINQILEILTETISLLKFTVTLSEEEINRLNNILGKQFYYFSHVAYFNTEVKDISRILDEFTMIYEKQIEGYNLSKDSNFGDDIDMQERELNILLFNSSFLLLLLVYKLQKRFGDKEIQSNEKYKKMVNIYKTNHNILKEEKLTNVKEFKVSLLNNFAYFYQSRERYKKEYFYSYKDVITSFILEDQKIISNENIEVVHNILLFADDIAEATYIAVGEILLNSKRITNDYYEFLKLKTLDLILSKFMGRKCSEYIKEFIEKIVEYIEANKTASHLLSVFSKIYLSIALYFSYKKEKESFEKSKCYYSIFVNTNGYRLLHNEYKLIYKKLLENYGKYYLRHLHKIKLKKMEYKSIGSTIAKEYLSYKDMETKYEINESISTLVNEILNKEGLDDEIISESVSDFISNKLFYGICFVFIEGLSKEKKILDKGYERVKLNVIEEYALVFDYPKVY